MAEYAFNPLSGKLDRVGDGGGGGGDITIAGDSGTPLTGTNFNIVGQESGTAPVVTVDTTSGDVVIANNAWQTAYVVDQSVVDGRKGTFSNIQDAVDAIVADGVATSTVCGIIQIRPDSYNPPAPIFIPPNVIIELRGNVDPMTSLGAFFLNDALLGIIISMDATSTLYLTNIVTYSQIYNNGGILFLDSCYVASTIINGGTLNAIDSTYNANVNFGATIYSNNCASISLDIANSFATLTKCLSVGINQVAGQININECQSLTLTINGAGSTANIWNTGLAQTIQGTPTNLYVSELYITAFGLNPVGFFGTGVQPLKRVSTKGNCYITRYIDDDYTILPFDHLINVLGNVAPVNLVIQPTTFNAGISGQSWKIFDMEGTAATNNITITPNAATINGAATYVINQNYGSAEIFFDGTNFFVI